MKIKKYLLVILSVFIFMFATGFDSEQQKIYDNADLLTESEEDKLQELCVQYANITKSDIVILTVDSLEGKTDTEYADDFYDYNNFGYEENMGTGVILLIDMGSRTIRVSTSGDLVENLPQKYTDKIIDDITTYLSNGNYYKACYTYVTDIDKYLSQYKDEDSKNAIINILIQIAAALVIGGVVTGIIYSGHSSKMTVNGYTYAKNHSSNVKLKQDRFIRRTTTRRHIESKSGGNGIHTGSSGNSHGGSSGHF